MDGSVEGLRFYGKRKKIPELKIFGSATINNFSGNVRTKSKIRDIRREVITFRNLNGFSGRIGKSNTD